MAWNESFTAGEGWAAPETSFSTGPSKDSQSNKLYDKFTVPVTISDIVDKVSAEEKYVLGDYGFTSIQSVGMVEELTEEDDSISYIIYDPEDETKKLKASQYMGTDGEGADYPRFFEGQRVQVVGKVRSFAGNLNVMAFGFTESSEDHYNAFKLEAKIAALYFTKNVPDMLRSGPVPQLATCPAGVPQNDTAMQGLNSAMNKGQSSANNQRLYNNTTAPAATSNGLTGHKAQVIQLIEAEKDTYGEQGVPIDEIQRKLHGVSIADVREACNFLVAEGHIYATLDDDHFAMI